ncbi:uncharacterized protein LOC113471844, partial [Diaphorina citri]|uniref:Uncharacterized protein LOC113471844 n=1 Tax=Diaphorina citri TaxID=121845 RepID=A0A3Q0JFB3_DIACI
MFTLIAISIDRYRYIKYENVNIQARYSSLFINLYIWLACTILVCIQKGIFKYKNIIEINPSMCKYEIKFNRDINYGLITITDILPFAVVLSILLYTYTVFGILLYYVNIYSKIRWKKLTKKLKEIDNIVEMSFNLIERKGEPACEDSGETKKVLAKDNGKKWKELKKQARSFSKARDDNKSKEETKIEEIDNQVAEGNEQTCVKETDNENAAGNRASGNQNKHNDTFDDKTSRSGNNLSTNTVTHADNNEIKKFTRIWRLCITKIERSRATIESEISIWTTDRSTAKTSSLPSPTDLSTVVTPSVPSPTDRSTAETPGLPNPTDLSTAETSEHSKDVQPAQPDRSEHSGDAQPAQPARSKHNRDAQPASDNFFGSLQGDDLLISCGESVDPIVVTSGDDLLISCGESVDPIVVTS